MARTMVAAPANLATCEYCGADIGWVLQPRGRWVPVDQTAHECGTVVLLEDGLRGINLDEEWVGERQRREIRSDDVPRFVIHFVTCGGRGGIRPLGWVLRRGAADLVNESRRRSNVARDRARDLGYRM